MSLLLIFLFGAGAVAAVYLAITPFLGSREQQAREELIDDELKHVEQLVASKSVLLQSLHEIEFEFETAKMAREDYERFRTKLERQAIGVMRKLDDIHGGRGWENQIDLEIAKRLDRSLASNPGTSISSTTEDPATSDLSVGTLTSFSSEEGLSEADVEHGESGRETTSTGLTCSSCGEPLEDDDKFCSKCGASVIAQPETQNQVAG